MPTTLPKNHGRTGATIYNIINPIGIYGGIAVAIGLSFSAWHLYKKLANLDAWQSGDTTAYTKAVKPAFRWGWLQNPGPNHRLIRVFPTKKAR